jgi:hemerythrin superfamily protein
LDALPASLGETVTEQNQDAIELITSDHRWVDTLFEALVAESSAGNRNSLKEEIVMSLSRHAAAEEQLLYPLARRRLGDGDPLVESALDEHQALKEALQAWDKMSAEDETFMVQAEQVQSLVQEHVEEEENVLLPKLSAAATAEELTELGTLLATAERMAPTRPHPGAPNRPPFNVVTGLTSAVIDKMRDVATNRGQQQ